MASCTNYYYSGQGCLYVAQRKANGTPQGFRQLGNVPSLEISIDVTKFEHKESCTGSRAIDLSIVQEKNGTFSMTLESISSKNLALAAWGTEGLVAAASAQTHDICIDDATLRYRLDAPNVDDDVAITGASEHAAAAAWVTATAYEVGDAVIPTAANGRVYFVASVADAGISGGVEPAFPTSAGDVIIDGGVTWTDGGLIALTETTDFVLDPQFGMISFVNPADIGVGVVYTMTYDHGDYLNMDALTETSQERWLRFEGLNTIDGEQVVLDLYRASLDPLQGYALINEEIAQIDISGNILLDASRPTGQQFFHQQYTNLAARI